jgi:signal transduction histidine kinase
MLHDFLTEHRDEIIERARAKVAQRRVPIASPAELANGVPLFLSQLTDLLRAERDGQTIAYPETTQESAQTAVGASAQARGNEQLREGLTVAQVVEGYGDICQAITEHATQTTTDISPAEYRTLNLCLDVATARAVSAFSDARDRRTEKQETERLGMLAHELRNLLSSALLAYQALKSGAVGIEGSTGALLGRSLRGLRDVIDRSLTEFRLGASLRNLETVGLSQLIEDVEVGAALDAKERGVELSVPHVDPAISVHGDRQLLASAVANLLQNAIKFTHPGGRISLTVRQEPGTTFIEVEDECGGLADAEALLQPFDRRHTSREGLGLGLKISREAVKANGGAIRVRNLPGKGCVFSIALPRTP